MQLLKNPAITALLGVVVLGALVAAQQILPYWRQEATQADRWLSSAIRKAGYACANVEDAGEVRDRMISVTCPEAIYFVYLDDGEPETVIDVELWTVRE